MLYWDGMAVPLMGPNVHPSGTVVGLIVSRMIDLQGGAVF